MAEVKIEGVTSEGSGRIVASVSAGHRFEVELPIKRTMREVLDAIEDTMFRFRALEPAATTIESRPVYIPDLSGADEGGDLTVEASPVVTIPHLWLRWRSSRNTPCAWSSEVVLSFADWDKILEDAKRQLRKATGDEWPSVERAHART